MYAHKSSVQLSLSPIQAEFIYWELLGLLSHYEAHNTIALEPHETSALLAAVCQLEAGLARSKAIGDVQLEHLRASISSLQTACPPNP